MLKFKINIHIAATPIPHNDKSPLFHIYSRYTVITLLCIQTTVRSDIQTKRISSGWSMWCNPYQDI